MRIAVGILIGLSGVPTVWASEPPPTATAAPSATPTDQPAAPAPGQDKPTPAEAPSTAPSATPSAPAAAAASPSKATAQPPKTPELTADEKNLLSHGYKLETRDGKKYFCHSESQLGTRFSTKVCRSEEQIAATRQNSKDYLNDVQRPSGNGITK